MNTDPGRIDLPGGIDPPGGSANALPAPNDRHAKRRSDIELGFQISIIILSIGLALWLILSVPPDTRMLVHSRHGSPIQLAPVAVVVPSIPLYFPIFAALKDRKTDPGSTVGQMVGGIIIVCVSAVLFLGAEIVLAVGFWQTAGVL